MYLLNSTFYPFMCMIDFKYTGNHFAVGFLTVPHKIMVDVCLSTI